MRDQKPSIKNSFECGWILLYREWILKSREVYKWLPLGVKIAPFVRSKVHITILLFGKTTASEACWLRAALRYVQEQMQEKKSGHKHHQCYV